MTRRIGIVPIGSVEVALLEGLGAGLRDAFDADFAIESPAIDPRFAFHPERQQHHATEILARLAGLTGERPSKHPRSQPAKPLEHELSLTPGLHPAEATKFSDRKPSPTSDVRGPVPSRTSTLLDPVSVSARRHLAPAAPTACRMLGVASVDLYIPILTFVFGEAQLEGPFAVVSYHRLRQEFYGLPPDPPLLAERLLKEAVHELGHTLGLVHCPDWRCVMASSHDVARIDLKGVELCPSCQGASALRR